MFGENYNELDAKINKLDRKVESAWSIINNYDAQSWKEVFDLITIISQSFKGVRYPTTQERDKAWHRYSSLRDRAFSMKEEQIQATSSYYRNDLYGRLKNLAYNPLADALVGDFMSLGLLSATKEEVKWQGKELTEVGRYFKSVKDKMTREHKSEIHERILEIRKSHDGFWSRYKDQSQQVFNQRKAENQRIWQEKQKAWEEKQEKSRRIKNRIEQNLESNQDKLRRAENALDRVKRNRDDLRDKIRESNNDHWISKAEGWLRESENKIEDIRATISRIEDWIREGRSKLDSWT